jgi:uncharacterized protein YbjT (DUF2867 family)
MPEGAAPDGVILVTGATGRQGGAVVRHLLQQGLSVRALTRNPETAKAKSLCEAGVELARGDMDDSESLKRAMLGARGVYSVQDFWTVGAQREVQQGKNVADAAAATGVEHFVFSSAGGAERSSRIDHFESKGVIERYIRKLGLPATIIRPVAFMENYYIPAVEKGLLRGRLVDPVKGDKPYQTIAADDIGKFVALAFASPDEFLGVELEIAGSELTNRQAAEVFARVLGRPVKFWRMPMPIVRVALGKEFFQMFRWFNEGGFEADVVGLRGRYPELGVRTLEQWLREEGWENKRAIRVKRDKLGRPLEPANASTAAGR